MSKYKDILGNERECPDTTITISIERYNALIIKEAIADGILIKTKARENNEQSIRNGKGAC